MFLFQIHFFAAMDLALVCLGNGLTISLGVWRKFLEVLEILVFSANVDIFLLFSQNFVGIFRRFSESGKLMEMCRNLPNDYLQTFPGVCRIIQFVRKR